MEKTSRFEREDHGFKSYCGCHKERGYKVLERFKVWYNLRQLQKRVGGTISRRYNKTFLDIPEGTVVYSINGDYTITNLHYSAADDMEYRMAQSVDMAEQHVKALKRKDWGYRDRMR
jgi:hypothetical protein